MATRLPLYAASPETASSYVTNYLSITALDNFDAKY